MESGPQDFWQIAATKHWPKQQYFVASGSVVLRGEGADTLVWLWNVMNRTNTAVVRRKCWISREMPSPRLLAGEWRSRSWIINQHRALWAVVLSQCVTGYRSNRCFRERGSSSIQDRTGLLSRWRVENRSRFQSLLCRRKPENMMKMLVYVAIVLLGIGLEVSDDFITAVETNSYILLR